jgi:5-hydroxyisourate hydrolase
MDEIAAAVFGARSSSSRARNVNGPATIFKVFTSGARIGLASATMATSLSTHVLDTAIGRPVSGVRVSLYRGTELIARGDTDVDGRIKELGRDLAAGSYRLLFAVKGPFFEEVALQMRLDDGHYHVPLLVTPFGCVTYRGS